jgi:hypothetical protein
MAKHRTHSIEFKRQVVQEFLGGRGFAKRAKDVAQARRLLAIAAVLEGCPCSKM